MGNVYFRHPLFSLDPKTWGIDTFAIGYGASMFLSWKFPRRLVLMIRCCFILSLLLLLLSYTTFPAEKPLDCLSVLLIGFTTVYTMQNFRAEEMVMYIMLFSAFLSVTTIIPVNLPSPLKPLAGIIGTSCGLLFFHFSGNPLKKPLAKGFGKPSHSVCMLSLLSCLMTLCSGTFAEAIPNGMFYRGLGLLASLCFFLIAWKPFRQEPLDILRFGITFSGAGFLLSAIGWYAGGLGRVSCFLLGMGMLPAGFVSYYGMVAFQKRAERFLSVGIIGSMLTAFILYGILEQDGEERTILLYGCFAFLLVLFSFQAFPWMLASLLAEEHTQSNIILFPELTGQEQRLMELIIQGYTTTQIARMMGITTGTEKAYRTSAYAKLGIHSRPELFSLVEKRCHSIK